MIPAGWRQEGHPATKTLLNSPLFNMEINREGELRVQLANPGTPGKMAVKTECACAQWL